VLLVHRCWRIATESFAGPDVIATIPA
jgi:hypothetical protein